MTSIYRLAAFSVFFLLSVPAFSQALGATQAPPPNPVVLGLKLKSPEVASDHTVTLRVYAPKAAIVTLSASWLGGTDLPMTKGADGVWTIVVGPLPPQMYGYWFLVDGVRALDPNNSETERDGSRYNSMLMVSGPQSAMWDFKEVPHGTLELVRRLVGTWSLTGLTYWASAMPVNVVTGTDPINLGYSKSYYQRPNRNPGVPLYLRGGMYAGGKAINPAAFLPVTTAFQGNIGRNTLRGFAAFQQDLSVQREFPMTDRVSAQLRAEVLNLTNHPNFGNPGTGSTNTNVLDAAGFGLSTMSLAQSLGAGGADGGFNPIYQAGGPRAIQLALKVNF